MLTSLLALLAGVQAAPPPPAPTPPAPPLPSDAIAADWRPIPDDELMIITLTGDRTVAIRLAPRLAPEHVANVRKLALAHWWDATSVYRVQENWVTQWGDDTEKKKLPENVVESPAAEFDIPAFDAVQRLTRADAYSTVSGVTADGWPVASDGTAAWIPHCYGTVGVARDALPNTGSGSELFTPISGGARRLDRNYTIVGRIVEGMKYMSAMPRSDATMGVYATAPERTAIVSVRLASDLPAAERPKFEYRSADNARFAAMIRLREHPAAPTIGLGGVDICDVPLAARRVGAK
ncbi:MAG: peptidylprolyl isomerase [Sphingomonas bacterium]|uniref:peptidylprolyl isomerase n=1 Tax=Sphingomonas bacterium TaxID=1895847 RepID=UPI0026070DD6|nr:peptidylprolyl isomerase [Sphingomonas bacterium]MDB5706095.1 peptidylprolyl isomerase [Sphingomonas bacterium]